MNILVAKNGSQHGPFSEADLRAKVSAGEYSLTDFGWYEGLTAWTPLGQLLGASSAPAAPPPPVGYAAPASGQPGAPQPYNSPYPSPYQAGTSPGWAGATGYAGFWRRFLAHFVDVIVLYIPIFLIQLVFGVVFIAFSGGRNPSPEVSFAVGMIALVVYCLYLVGVWLYFAIMESSARQATVGKMAMGIKVTDLGGNRISFGQATGRFFGKFLSSLFLGIGYIMAGVTERKQAMHDMLASTLVVLK